MIWSRTIWYGFRLSMWCMKENTVENRRIAYLLSTSLLDKSFWCLLTCGAVQIRMWTFIDGFCLCSTEDSWEIRTVVDECCFVPTLTLSWMLTTGTAMEDETQTISRDRLTEANNAKLLLDLIQNQEPKQTEQKS